MRLQTLASIDACVMKLRQVLVSRVACKCLAWACFCLTTESILAQRPAVEVLALPTITAKVEEVSLMLTVTDRHGKFVRNLDSSDFLIFDNNQPPKRITYFEKETDLPLRVALLIDNSDSVTYQFRFEQRAAKTFLHHVLRSTSDLGLLIGFNQEAKIEQPATNDMSLLANALKKPRLGGETAIYSAISVACQELRRIPGQPRSRNAIILITDGEDNRSRITLKQASDWALGTETVIYVVSTRPVPLSKGDENDRRMSQLAELSGGKLVHADGDEGLPDAFDKIEYALRSQYALAFKPMTTGAPGLFHHLVVVAPEKLRVSHRQGYFSK
jgi:Ca-activated chloride channel family protein